MTVSTLLLFGSLSAGLALALGAFVGAVVNSGVARLRVDLWSLHDDIVDGLVANRYSDVRGAEDLRHVVRLTIAHAREFTFLNVFGSSLLIGRREAAVVDSGARAASPSRILTGRVDDEILLEHRKRLIQVVSFSIFRTTFFGRFGLVLVPAVFIVRSIFRRSPVDQLPTPEVLAARPTRTELKLEVVLNAASPREAKALAGAAC